MQKSTFSCHLCRQEHPQGAVHPACLPDGTPFHPARGGSPDLHLHDARSTWGRSFSPGHSRGRHLETLLQETLRDPVVAGPGGDELQTSPHLSANLRSAPSCHLGHQHSPCAGVPGALQGAALPAPFANHAPLRPRKSVLKSDHLPSCFRWGRL